MRLTAAEVRTLQCAPGRSEQVFFDETLPGFGLRVRTTGAKTWLVQYAVHGRTRRIFLGPPTLVDASKARSMAKDLLASVRLGGDPAGEKVAARAEAANTVRLLLPRFLSRQRARLKPRSLEETTRHLEQHARPLHGHPVQAVNRRMIAMLLADITERSGPAASNSVRSSISAFLGWCAREGLIEGNAAAFTNRATEAGARERVLSGQELAHIWRASGDGQYGALVKLLMLTGCRRAEIGALRWDEIDLDAATATLSPVRTKNRRKHVVPLSPAAIAILRERWAARDPERDGMVFGSDTGHGFQDWSGSKAELDQRLVAAGTPIDDWVLHDFRRSLSTTLHEWGTPPNIVETALGHAEHKRGAAGAYNQAIYLDERRRLLERWAGHLHRLVTGEVQPARIVRLPGARN
jgi:integrase